MKVKPNPPKIASGFHGGGGAIKIDEKGTETIPTGCMCGALAAGVLILGILYGRTSGAGPRFGCISYLSAHLHRRFQEELGGKCCALLRPFYQKIDSEKSCKFLYQKGAELAVEVALSAPDLVPECRMPGILQRLIKRIS
ncbi:MAG: C_GCAxxG_C_C family protein [Syntrophaceae bacterium]|nr:C_GCAxxG_C_C family protein [Syntrophaceae bacterium]